MDLIDNVTLVKFTASIILATFFTACATGCGVSLGDSFVAGTTGYLAEHNRGNPLDEHTQSEKNNLEQVIARRY